MDPEKFMLETKRGKNHEVSQSHASIIQA